MKAKPDVEATPTRDPTVLTAFMNPCVYGELLRMSESEIAALANEGVI
jgi:hypothetical protein